jgi:superfamily I DNA/RNA helicase
VLAAHAEPSVLPTIHRNRLTRAIYSILGQLHSLLPRGISDEHETYADLMQVCRSAAEVIVADPLERDSLLNEFAKAAEAFNATSVEKLLRATEVTSEDIEQELEEGKVNILTMHKAKGLTAEAVIVVAAEDEYIPGRAVGDDIDDERRLLYVSLTRAKHHLFVTYCDRRTGRQRHTGRDGGRTARSLTRFLRDGPLTPHDGQTFINNLANEPT